MKKPLAGTIALVAGARRAVPVAASLRRLERPGQRSTAPGTQPNFRRYLEQTAPQFLFPRLDEKFWSYYSGPYEAMAAKFDEMGTKSKG